MKILKIIFWIILALTAFWLSRFWLFPALDNSIFQNISYINTNPKTIPNNRDECLAAGGDWSKEGLAPKETCRFSTRDANKFCFVGFQCQTGKCLAKMNLDSPAIFSTGVCARYATTYGCYQEVHFGLTNKRICRD